MGRFGVIDKLKHKTRAMTLYDAVTLGEVVSSDDPQQMGRLKVFVPALDSDRDQPLPWAFYGSPFGGVSESTERGRSGETSSGPVAYGMWAIPKVGSTVMIMCLDENPDLRVWLGCVHGLQFPHTLPHGRYLEKDGPLTSAENPIEPLYSTQATAFTSDASQVEPRESFEYQTRGADRPVAAMAAEQIGTIADVSRVADDETTQGYGADANPNQEGKHSNIYSFTTPGFHSWSMDDNPASCRLRLRTSSGNQIIFDDSNERIYISTAKGKTWIELDEAGTLDIYSEQDLSLRSQQDVNIVSDKTVRIAGKEGVHVTSQGSVMMYSGADIQLKATDAVRFEADNVFTTAATDVHLNAASNVRIKGSGVFVEGEGSLSILAPIVDLGSKLNVAGPLGVTGQLDALGPIASSVDVRTPTHSLNLHTHTYIAPAVPAPPPAQPGMTTPQLTPTGSAASATANPQASDSKPAETTTAFFPSRAPQHEPFARVYLDMELTDNEELELGIFDSIITDPDSVSEYDYVSEQVGTGSAARGRTFSRNAKWQR